MDEVEKISTRDAYGHTLISLGELYPDLIVLDANVSGATRTKGFKKAFPDRHFDCGIAEANMICMAAGIASTGRKVIASAFAIFVAGRAYEQIRTSIGYTQLPVIIGATHAGLCVGKDGATHQCTEDIALMRSIPGMVVISPADSYETASAMDIAITLNRPVYLRLCKLPVPILYGSNYKFVFGKGEIMIEGDDATLIATGIMVSEAINAARVLRNENIFVRVINISTIKPIDKEIIIDSAAKTGVILTIEDHSIVGGLGDAVSEVVGETIPVPVIRIGVKDSFGRSGTPGELMEVYGLCTQNICAKVKEGLSKKE